MSDDEYVDDLGYSGEDDETESDAGTDDSGEDDSGDSGDSGEDNNPETIYFNSKEELEDDYDKAIKGFDSILTLLGQKKVLGFKALKQIVKAYFEMEEFKNMITRYKEMLTYIHDVVPRPKTEKCLTSLIEMVANSKHEVKFVEEFFNLTRGEVEKTNNDKFWFKITMRLANIWLKKKEHTRLMRILRELHKSVENQDGTLNQDKGTQMLEINAVEIQLYTELKDHKRLKGVYNSALQIKTAIPHPNILGIIKESGGKMFMSERQWKNAYNDFFEAFKAYDEAGSPRRLNCLKYLVLANMLMSSDINPFNAQETKPYENHPEIVAMTSLIHAHMHDDINKFEKILRDNRSSILEDEFMKDYIQDLLKNIRCQVLVKIIRPYTRIKTSFAAQELNISKDEVEELLVSLILDSKIRGKIDQIQGTLEVEADVQDFSKYQALQKWGEHLQSLHNSIISRLV
ncbi:cop9 signalosome complex subunit 2 [Anaeramoeba ignava]|uniref:Cop9 signalosome complex subunit 2 n=1 Tax=Anaeramoeba ignava TaxID=1746090 RepID=A0A9Q0LME5_ANAIG|nr:cop9 signalosome complex subunit 2 [Anaeramoeba ignava]|eukprot:Anaeramoba_ignava/a403_1142.p1 GENE.a403_1142~~a403_1142.p1  ORF type:complete len:479 (+),score=145.51 a403_1142:66-1439(+)